MGIVHKPSIPMYWSTDALYNTPIFSRCMKRTRFQLILKFLHFNNNDNYDRQDDDRDRLHKLRPFLELVRERCKKVYSPGKELSVDKSLVLFKGRLAFKQFIRTKRARFGIKLYELCTSTGITLDFLVYCGRGMFYNDEIHSDMLSTERIPAVLMNPFLNKGHILFTYNHYTSPTLGLYFLQNGTHLVGTVRNNQRFFPKDLVKVELEKGTAAFYNSDHMVACKFRALQDKSGNKQKVEYSVINMS